MPLKIVATGTSSHPFPLPTPLHAFPLVSSPDSSPCAMWGGVWGRDYLFLTLKVLEEDGKVVSGSCTELGVILGTPISMPGKELAAVDKANLPKPEASVGPTHLVTSKHCPHRDRN